MFVDKVLKKIPREIYIYILWGIVVGAVNLGSAWIFMYKCGIEPVRANFLAWILYNFVSFIQIENRCSTLSQRLRGSS